MTVAYGEWVPDPIFDDPRFAAVSDFIDDDRRDLEVYVAIADEIGARRVIDLGCGTGEMAIRLAGRGLTVVGVDPAAASLDVARSKEGAELVTWILGDASELASHGRTAHRADLITMTGNVAQILLTDAEWNGTIRCVRAVLDVGDHLVFETRDPAFRGWEEWTPSHTRTTKDTPNGPVESWVELLDVDLPLVTFRWTYRFLTSGDVLTSDSTLRFRDRDELVSSLRRANFVVDEIRDAPDRPGRELVVVARAKTSA